MDPPPPNSDTLIQQFCSFTDASPEEAEDCLRAHGWHVESSVSTWFAAQEGDGEDAEEVASEAAPAASDAPQSGYVPGGGRTLRGGPAPAAAASSSSSSGPAPPSSRRAPPARGGPRTLKDLQSDGGHGHAHDDDSEDEDQDMFAGGEKSGLAVQNPGNSNPQDQINNILDRARRNVPRPGGDEPEPSPSRFTGRGVTLGGEGAESAVVVDPTPSTRQTPPRVSRTLHLWSDGFSVDDGPLFRYDDPANHQTLQMIQAGRAPLDLLNVEHGQEVDLQLDNQKETKFVQPKKKYVPFSGTGQRLGSPTPGVASSSSQPVQTSMQIPSSAAPEPAASSVNVNEAQPTITLQIRLGDGTRLQSRFNTTHTIGDVYSFVDAASTASAQRAYALMTTFPNKELDNKSEKLGDLPEFKRGGVVVQKWK